MSSQNSGFYTPEAGWYSRLNDYNCNHKWKISASISGVSTILVLAEPEILSGTYFTGKCAPYNRGRPPQEYAAHKKGTP